MSYLWLPIGLALPTLCGWLLLGLAEGATPVLHKAERIVAGFVLGSVLVPFAMFLAQASGVGNFGVVSMIAVQLILCAALGALYFMRNTRKPLTPLPPLGIATWPLPQQVIAGLLGAWFVTKMIAQWILLIGPAYFDDTVKNWNLRAKAFYEHKELVLELVDGKPGGVSSYPPTVSLLKTWLVSLNGGWHEGLANAIHILWFFAALYLLYCVLRRLMNGKWALLGTYILSSIPLYALHGGIAYADQFLSVVIFLVVSWLMLAIMQGGDARSSFLRIGAVACGLMAFTKNEALLLHLPPMGLFIALLLGTTYLSTQEKKTAALWYGISVALVTLPWIAFKWSNHLTFGNAKSVSGLELAWHEGVLRTIAANTFAMGHWSLFPVLFVTLLAWQWKMALKTPLVIATAFFVIVWFFQLPIYLFTGLYAEALNQTGYARGIIHLVPVAVLVATVLLHDAIARRYDK